MKRRRRWRAGEEYISRRRERSVGGQASDISYNIQEVSFFTSCLNRFPPHQFASFPRFLANWHTGSPFCANSPTTPSAEGEFNMK